MSEWTDSALRNTSDAGDTIKFDGKNYVCRIENGVRIWDLDSTGPGGIYAFRTPNITKEGSYTYPFPDDWTGGKPDEVFVTTVYPKNDALSVTHFQLVSFDATSVTIYCQNYNTTAADVYANILLVKSFTGNSTGSGSGGGFGNIEIVARVAITGSGMVDKSTNFNVTSVSKSERNMKVGSGRSYYTDYVISFANPLTKLSWFMVGPSGHGNWTGTLTTGGASAKLSGRKSQSNNSGYDGGVSFASYLGFGEGSEIIFIK